MPPPVAERKRRPRARGPFATLPLLTYSLSKKHESGLEDYTAFLGFEQSNGSANRQLLKNGAGSFPGLAQDGQSARPT